MARRRMSNPPKSSREARGRGRRKLRAFDRIATDHLYALAGYFDEGRVSNAIDMLLYDIRERIEEIHDAMDAEVARDEEEEA